MNDSLYFKRVDNVAARRIGDELMVMSGRTSELFSLNETAALLWDAADGATPLADIVERIICPAFDIDAGSALRDARELVEQLASHGILEIADRPFAAAGSPAQ
ncbi:MAG: PqqD family protein [Rubrivivax sp.]|nr:MAG: PqqD family protein [Rubrivivax sp.]